MTFYKFVAISTMMAGFAASALAQDIDVKNGWVRTSVQGQSATGAFMTITAKQDTRLVGIVTPVAGVAEVHEMKMDGGVMKMRAVEGGLALPAGKPVELSPGGYHVMLMDLKAALPKDSTVPLTLVFKNAKGIESRVELKLPVATSATAHKH
ncbi:MAG: copper chaperone PCu(A)C [Burkholderiaceae bacterium]